MPTAFCARWGKSGPVLGTYAEYDAVPGNSQQVVPYQAPCTGFHPWSAGHTDPHSARRHSPGRWQRRRQWRGSASPAPCSSSASPPKRSAAQCRCTLPRAITTAPTPSSLVTRTSPTQRSATRSAARIGALFHVRDSRAEEVDRQEPHSDDPHLACGGPLPGCDRRALPDVYDDEIYQGGDVPAHRHLDPERVRLVGGEATSDNLPPRFSQIQFAWRAPSLGTQQQIYTVLEQNARHVAAMTGCRASVRWVTKTRVGLTNRAMTNDRSNLRQYGVGRRAAPCRRGARLSPADPVQSRPNANGKPVHR
jgi:aminobenzoyl-glutamate utilization protein B